MYESFFGLSGPPFQLNPDPSFYFGSRGHSNALAYLKFGVYQGEGFIVVTGDIGAGKTTLVRTLLEGLDPGRVVAAQVVSTRLESVDLLRAILTAFGVPPKGESKAQLIAAIEGFLTTLAVSERRALLVVDEAQNLNLEAIEELRMLSNFQFGTHALLQSFLVGQPELRGIIESRALEQLRQRIIASCHLGPLDVSETRAYVEHRLRHVGWSGSNPAFEPEAFDEIQRWTCGIPRRINVLCNRLMLAAFLGGGEAVSAALVEQTARELRGEVGDSSVLPAAPPVPAEASAAPAPAPARPAAAALPPPAPAAARPAPVAPAAPAAPLEAAVVRHVHRPLDGTVQPLLCVVDTPTAWLKLGALAQVLAAEPGLPPVIALNPGAQEGVSADEDVRRLLPGSALDIHLGVATQGFAQGANTLQQRFAAALDEFEPAAVLLLGQSDAVLACSLVASRRGLPLVRLEAGLRHGAADSAAEGNAVMMDRLASQLYTSELTAHYTLCREGIPANRAHWVGSLLEEALQQVLPGAPLPEESGTDAPAGMVLVTLQFEQDDPAQAGLPDFVAALARLGAGLDLRWIAEPRTLAALSAHRLEPALLDAGVQLVPATRYLERLGMLRQARCLIGAPQGDLLEEARVLGMPRVVVCPAGTVPVPAEEAPGVAVACEAEPLARAFESAFAEPASPRDPEGLRRDGGAARRVALHLMRTLPKLAAPRAAGRAAEPAEFAMPAYSTLLRTSACQVVAPAGSELRAADPTTSPTNG
ncbi:XrtA/PEP-CTERM system-associated ATPase [Caldimonas tepidiphila]|uniref:XrtA/PEP-CTERM system-associated ATPase n=1 Tax=Caldimonas tepidiphila TaxID=2315841 RepID=UPI000E5B9B95|nr:XrtA/PEP-CTERM system-associated ATPase [Caldimonas tepidiphila]